MNDKIKVFAVDHRKNVEWKLPFIRLGTGYDSDAELRDSIGNNILKYDKTLSEGTAMWWIYNNQSQISSCDYIGFCTYRRFLGLLKPNFGVFPICNVPKQYQDNVLQHILDPDRQLSILKNNNIEMLLPIRFPDYTFQGDSKCVQEVMYRSSVRFDMNLGIPRDVCYKVFDILLENTPKNMKNDMRKTFSILNTYHFDVFTFSRQLYDLYNKIMWKSIFDCLEYVNNLNISTLSNRWMSYVLERFTSCIILMFQLQGNKYIEFPTMFFE